MSPDDPCGHEACAKTPCTRREHAYTYERGDYRYGRCLTHRACTEFSLAAPPPVVDPEVEQLRAELDKARRLDALLRAEVVELHARLAAASARPVVQTPVQDARDEVPAAASPAAGTTLGQLLGRHASHWCPICRNGYYRPRTCCKTPTVHVIAEIRRAPDSPAGREDPLRSVSSGAEGHPRSLQPLDRPGLTTGGAS
jgi:hypothetical protein